MRTRSVAVDCWRVPAYWSTPTGYHSEVETLPLPTLATDQGSRRRRFLIAAITLAGCELVGVVAVVAGYHSGESAVSNTSEFAWFWAGMLLLTLPLAGLAGRRATPAPIRTALLVLYGLVSYAPKLLRNPASPLYHDEFAHWLETNNILKTGKLFEPNPIILIVSRYPGLHAATAELVRTTGLTIWHSAMLLLLLFHVTLVIGIAELAQALGFNNRTAALVAIFYSCNSSFLYFDTQYAYESMAITLAVWALVSYVRAIGSLLSRRRATWLVLTIVLSAGTIITHHLSTFILILIMALISLALSSPWLASGEQWIRTAVTAWSMTLFTAIMAGAWSYFVAPGTIAYLSPYVSQGFSQLLHLAQGSGGGRQLFGASLSPWWEQKSAYLVIVFALALAVGGLLIMRTWIKSGELPRGRRRALLIAFTVLGLTYFPSILFILAPSGAEGARRTWTFTWIGLGMLAGPAMVWLVDWGERQIPRWRRISIRAVLVFVLAIALIGGTAAGINASYRFPGPYLYGSDARSITPELLGASRWFLAQLGADNNIVTDRYTRLIFASFGLQNTDTPSPGFPTWDLYLDKPGRPIGPASLLYELTISHYTYLIVDRRMGYEVPAQGVYFGPDEPGSLITRSGEPALRGRLGKFNATPWMVKVFQSDNYSIYRLDLPPSKMSASKIRHHHPLPRGRFLVSG
jgi:hypothetical protein